VAISFLISIQFICLHVVYKWQYGTFEIINNGYLQSITLQISFAFLLFLGRYHLSLMQIGIQTLLTNRGHSSGAEGALEEALVSIKSDLDKYSKLAK
jgi:hypothetical protein